VVASWDEEVFFASEWWWVHRDGRWYRASAPQLPFFRVEPARVPLTVTSLPPGRYLHAGEVARPSPKAEPRRGRRSPATGSDGGSHVGGD